jgi:thymidylate synthase ThyX
MNNISAKIIADSINKRGDRITTFLLTYPRIIHAEVMTHRMFSKNSSSSRAIPFEKMLEEVTNNPFIPIAFQKTHKGMQGNEYFDDYESHKQMETIWLKGRDKSIEQAKNLNSEGVTKQLCNRLLEPYLYHTILLTGTDFNNFFDLRCPKYEILDGYGQMNYYKSKNEIIKTYPYSHFESKSVKWLNINKSQAEIHIQDLSEKMYDCYNENIPTQLQEGEWHIPFNDKMNDCKIISMFDNYNTMDEGDEQLNKLLEYKIKISTARCARLSYMTFDNEIDYEKDLELHNRLLESRHYSPFEHCSKTMTEEEYNKFSKKYIDKNGIETEEFGWCRNFKGFIQYRHLID